MAACSSAVHEPVTQGSMAWSTSAPVRPTITPTRCCCSASVKFSANSGQSSCSSARTCCSRLARVAAVRRASAAAAPRASASVAAPATRRKTAAISSNSCASCWWSSVYAWLTCRSASLASSAGNTMASSASECAQ